MASLVDPYGDARSAFLRARGVDEMTSLRDGKRGHAGVRAHEDAVRDGEWLAGYFELL